MLMVIEIEPFGKVFDGKRLRLLKWGRGGEELGGFWWGFMQRGNDGFTEIFCPLKWCEVDGDHMPYICCKGIRQQVWRNYRGFVGNVVKI